MILIYPKSVSSTTVFDSFFCNETSAVEKENFRIKFLKKTNELFKKLLIKLMTYYIFIYIMIFFKNL